MRAGSVSPARGVSSSVFPLLLAYFSPCQPEACCGDALVLFSPWRKGGRVTLKPNRCFRRRIGVSAPAGAEGAGRLCRAGRAGGCARGQPRELSPASPGRFSHPCPAAVRSQGCGSETLGWQHRGRARQSRGHGQERTPAVRLLAHVEITGAKWGTSSRK